MPSYPNDEFAAMWQKVTDRYFKETQKQLKTKPDVAAFVAHLRTITEIDNVLLESTGGDQEGLAIYLAFKEIGKRIEINLGERYYTALKLYADGEGASSEFDQYYEYLRSFYTKKGNLGEEDLSLQDIYIEPSTQVKKYNRIPLLTIILEWINHSHGDFKKFDLRLLSNSFNNIILILGDPGQGKTSFCYRLLYEIAGKIERPIYFFRLRYIQQVENFYEDPFNIIFKHIIEFGYKPYGDITYEIPITKDRFKESILILDGLDELDKILNLDNETFVERLANLTNRVFRPYKLVITSRKEINTYYLSRLEIPCLSINELTITEQFEWIKKYNTKGNLPYKISLEDLKILNEPLHALRPVIGQPILLHILSQINILPNSNYNSSKVYDDLFTRLITRYWHLASKLENSHPNLKQWISSPEQLRIILQLISLEMFYRNTTYLSHEQIPDNILRILGLANDQQVSALKVLSIAFYFNYTVTEVGKHRKYAVEFFHKTFSEYLAAEALWYEIKKIFNSIDKPKDAILFSIVKLFSGKAIINDQINNYLIEIIQNERSEKNTLTAEQRTILTSIKYYLEHLCNSEFNSIDTETNKAISTSLQVFYGLLCIYNRLEGELKYFSNINNINYFYLIKILFQRYQYLRFDYANLNEIELAYFSYNGSRFDYAQFNKAYLEGSDLKNSSFEHASLKKVNMIKSDLRHTNFQFANLSESILSYSKFTNANLRNVNLIKAKLDHVNLSDSTLASANLIGASLNGANLSNADLSNAHLHKSDLSEAELSNTNFSNANLSFVSFINAKGLTLRNLSRAKSLYMCTGLEANLLNQLKKEFPYLFIDSTSRQP
ncbi:pentapeptide repeat-containing protein [Spirosoma panaciterrae]|uniref:pentapeptide repeat-containing protein n=1 Tax=Spirosoma panaciterrae TaxID=496058 RepID=UPI0003696422|nr:pentapeptide repeat-containing protein [Spirosoma panaciterrae]